MGEDQVKVVCMAVCALLVCPIIMGCYMAVYTNGQCKVEAECGLNGGEIRCRVTKGQWVNFRDHCKVPNNPNGTVSCWQNTISRDDISFLHPLLDPKIGLWATVISGLSWGIVALIVAGFSLTALYNKIKGEHRYSYNNSLIGSYYNCHDLR